MMRNHLSLSFTSLAYTIAFTLLVQLVFVLFAIAAIQRTQFESLTDFYIGVLMSTHGQSGNAVIANNEALFCGQDVQVDENLIALLNNGLQYPGNGDDSDEGVINLAYSCATKKLTPLGSVEISDEAQGPRIELSGDGIIADLAISIRLVWLLLTDGESNIYTFEQMADENASVLLSFNKSYLSGLLTGHLRQYLIVALLLITLNVMFVFILVRNFISQPIRHLTNSLKTLTSDRRLPGGRDPVPVRGGFQFREIHAANTALRSINDQLEPRWIIEARKDGIDHEIRNDLQRLFGQIYFLDPPERLERLLTLLQARLNNRLNDILKFVTWRKSVLEREQVSIAETVRTCAELTIDVCGLSGAGDNTCPELICNVPDDLHVLANRNGMRIILENLFRNSVDAFKTSSKMELRDSLLKQLAGDGVPGETIELWRKRLDDGTLQEWQKTISLTAIEEDDQVRITISDTADGIERHLQDRVFDRGVSSNQDDEVMRGIGLLYVRMLATELDGRVTMTWTRHRDDIHQDFMNTLGKGSIDAGIMATGTTFELVLPQWRGM